MYIQQKMYNSARALAPQKKKKIICVGWLPKWYRNLETQIIFFSNIQYFVFLTSSYFLTIFITALLSLF